MMSYLAAAIAGAYFVQRNAPRTKLQRMKILGTKTGLIYEVDLVPHLGIVIIHAPDGSHAVFQKKEAPSFGFTFLRGVGNGAAITGMKQDLEA